MSGLSLYFLSSSIMLPFLSVFRSNNILLGSDVSGCNVPHNVICWNFVQSAGYYSQFAGVMAGFIFVAIPLLLTPANSQKLTNASDNQTQTLTLRSLFVTFFSLLSSSFLFAEIVGEQTTMRALTLGDIASLGLVLAALQVMLSMNWLFKAYALDKSIQMLGWWLFQATMLIGWLDMYFLFYDMMWMRTDINWTMPTYQAIVIGVAGYFLPLSVAMFVGKRMAPQKYHGITLYCSAALIALVSAAFGYVSNLTEAMIHMTPINYFTLAAAIPFFILPIFFFFYQLILPYTPYRQSKRLFREKEVDQPASPQSNIRNMQLTPNIAVHLPTSSHEKSTHRPLSRLTMIAIFIAISSVITIFYRKRDR